MTTEVSDEQVEEYYQQLKEQAEASGYHLNKDIDFTKELLKSILINLKRYGYGACPCRLASGEKKDDLDIICPCDYRDPDINDFGACYCGLYVSEQINNGKRELQSIPERRPAPEERKSNNRKINALANQISLPVWRCKVCGYLCAREEAPETCPICKVSKERFERFL